jgi:tetratricopeptide (TPR) repeat protein
MNETTQPHKIADGGSSRPARRGLWIGLLILILLIILGALCGGGTGILSRQRAEASQVAQSLDEQFALSQEDVTAGRYAIARQRLEYILGEDSEYPGAQAMLADVIVKQQITPAPSDTPTPSITPTPDLTQADTLFSQVQEQLAAGTWDTALNTLDELRVAAPAYKAAVVDGMYYIALRNRGVDKIITQHNLEGGIKDLGLAERFGPLDGLADGYRTFAETYVRGASFWDTDWQQAAFYFGQVAPYLPFLSDSSGLTAQERYRLALVGWGTSLYNQQEWCKAEDILTEALDLGDDDEARHLRNEASDKCHPPRTAGPTDTPTLEGGGTPPPTESPTKPPTEPPTENPPTDTPTPTP